MRYFIGAGRGGFGISPAECWRPTFYCVAYSEEIDHDATTGWRVQTSQIPPKPPFFSRLKSTNYLPNALAQQLAEESDHDLVRSLLWTSHLS